MKRVTLRMAFLALFGLSMGTVSAQTSSTNKINTITTAVPFLRISPDARSSGMGETGIAGTPDAYSYFFNNGKTPFSESNFGIAATYTLSLIHI